MQKLEHLTQRRAVSLLSVTEQADNQGRDHVRWQYVVLQLVDDWTGSLPLLRHIIVNDDKSATYKLGLLRTLLRIADGAPGMVQRHTDECCLIDNWQGDEGEASDLALKQWKELFHDQRRRGLRIPI